MTLDEAISRYESNAEYERTHESLQGCLEFRQLAEWLKELKAHREAWMKVVSEVDKHTELHSDGEFYVKNFDVKKIIAEYKSKEGDAE